MSKPRLGVTKDRSSEGFSNCVCWVVVISSISFSLHKVVSGPSFCDIVVIRLSNCREDDIAALTGVNRWPVKASDTVQMGLGSLTPVCI